MLNQIIAFKKDEFDDWVAMLECGHNQHVRHDPPWTNRPWVETCDGRKATIGKKLNCKKCDRGEPRDFELTESAGKSEE